MPSPKLVPLLLADAERKALEALARKRTASQALALRARIVLACAEDGGVAPLTAVAGRTGVSREQVEVVVTRVLTEKGPGQDTHWSTRSMAGETGLSQSSVSRIWRAFGLKPHLVETWKLSADPEFIAKVRDVVGSGSVIAQPYRRHRHQEFLRFLKLIDAAVPKDLDLHLVLDNYATRKTPAIRQWLLKHPRSHLHFTPTSSSWLNLVERWFAELTSRKLRRSRDSPDRQPGQGFRIPARTGDDAGMSLGLEVTFTCGHVLFPAGHLSRIGGTFDGTLAAPAIRDADPAAAPPEIRTLSGETLFVSAVQQEELEQFCRASQIPVRKRPDIWGDLLELFVDTEFTPEYQEATRTRLNQAGLTDSEISQIRAKVAPLMLAYNAFHWDWAHLGLADLLDALTTDKLPGYLHAGLHVEEIRAELGETASFYAWAMRIANRTGPQSSA